ncbi:hypothetical protein N474_10030 [Pseudoalteromonas luteoviolacea CPMOR-2]|uniref:GNAT family N-acetyltransferase n=1 Tax=Pseudoalteromonas luteoviolacea TaxID=43657 RepID=UPI0007B075E2|nr:GNAT family N-acetyltransferase [Pseudoalteromonas luteoviolacea]KZN56950.1 hypothetical protein N474_10030 [Pseudoalteromonas luteoviolacea CPMOR-2]
MSQNIVITTKRCDIRKAHFSDVAFIIQLLNQKSFIENIGDKNVSNEQAAREYIEKSFLTPYQSGLVSPYIVCLKSGEQIGVGGFYQRPYLTGPDLGYAFLDEYTGQGLAIEACTALMDFAKNELSMKAVYAVTDPNNVSSQKLLAKLGFKNSGYLYAHSMKQPISLFAFQSA